MLDVLPQLVANDGLRTLRAAIADPHRYAIEPKIDGVRGLTDFRPDRVVETRNRRGQVRDWQRHRAFASGLRGLVGRLPILRNGTVLDTELVAERFAGTMAGAAGFRSARQRSPRPCVRILLMERRSTYRDGSRIGWSKVKTQAGTRASRGDSIAADGPVHRRTPMADLDFSTDRILSQAKGNLTAIWHVTLRWAKEQAGGVDGWASFVGQAFAPSWDELGDSASALEVARLAGLNFATTADMKPVDLSGDDSRAELNVTGPNQETLDDMSTTTEELDRSNELIFSAIAQRRGLKLTTARIGDTLTLTFERN
jgi:hypothetical protein